MKASERIHHTWAIFPIVLVTLSVGVIATLLFMTQHSEHALQDNLDDAHMVLLDHVQDRARLLLQANASVSDIARVLGSPRNGNLSSFSTIENKVVPGLFMAFTTLSWVSQISYVGLDGLLFSYYHEGDQVHAMFSNMSDSSNDSTTYHWYSQQVNEATGERYGDLVSLSPVQSNDSQWFHDALNGNSGHASWGFGWGKASDQMLFFSAPVSKIGVVSLGVSVKDFVNYVSDIELHGAFLRLYTGDRHFLPLTGSSDTQYLDQNVTLSMEQFPNLWLIDDNICTKTGALIGYYLDIQGDKYKFGCASFDAAGIRFVSVLALPCKGVVHLFQTVKIIAISLLAFVIIGLVVGSYVILQLFRRLQEQEIFLLANLIKQKEAIQQAERKSMNKSLAFASASHDVRTSLAGITGLIDICRGDVPRDSELDRNLEQMNACASKLLGILNSVLDISKVEAGKMHLEEVEFNMAQVLEESVDMFHIIALKKDLEVIWDPCDFSILRSSNVKGDCGRLKQILDNLLSNAVKFTSVGHVVVRAWSKKPNLEDFTFSSRHGCQFSSILCPLSRWLCKDKDACTDMGTLSSIQLDPSSIEFIFEVDDTGMGIPREKRASVFENYVQVKESTSGGHEGTGLGLGIVQSFVRLMGGEINIQDNEPGKRGTCFRFNIFLKSIEMSSDDAEEENTNSCRYQVSNQLDPLEKGLKVEGIHSLLLVEGVETQSILHRWMGSLGIKVWEVDHHEHLYPMFENIKHNTSGSGKFESTSDNTSLNRTKSHDSNIEKDGPSSYKDELPLSTKDVYKKTSYKGSSTYILVVIDFNCVNLSDICSILNKFSKDSLSIQCKVIWLVNSNDDLRRLKQEPYDLILQKPCHGSRLYKILRLMQEFGGTNEGHPFKMGIENSLEGVQQFNETCSSMKTSNISYNPPASQSSNLAEGPTSYYNNDKPLSGMNILLVEDTPTLRLVNSKKLSRLGATVETSENGLEAVNLIKTALHEAAHAPKETIKTQGGQKRFPYDVVLMDCEMPIMNGYEATRSIRAEEKQYGLHIPIIALTAHATSEEEQKTKRSGMDLHLVKPIDQNMILEAFHSVCQN